MIRFSSLDQKAVTCARPNSFQSQVMSYTQTSRTPERTLGENKITMSSSGGYDEKGLTIDCESGAQAACYPLVDDGHFKRNGKLRCPYLRDICGRIPQLTFIYPMDDQTQQDTTAVLSLYPSYFVPQNVIEDDYIVIENCSTRSHMSSCQVLE